MGFKFDDDDDEIVLSGSKETVSAPIPPQPEKTSGRKKPVKEPKIPAAAVAPKPVQPKPVEEPATTPPPPPPVQEPAAVPITPPITPPVAPPTVLQPEQHPQQQYVPPTPQTYDTGMYQPQPYQNYPQQNLQNQQYQPQPLPTQTPILNPNNGFVPPTIEEDTSGVQANIFFEPKEEKKSRFARPANTDKTTAVKKQVQFVRGAIILTIVLLVIGTVSSFIPRPGFTDDPTARNLALTQSLEARNAISASESYVLQFTQDYLNRTEELEPERRTQMLRYLTPNAFSSVEFRLPTIRNNSNREVTVYQKITDGPYIFKTENINSAQVFRQNSEVRAFLMNHIVRVQVQKYVTSSDFTVTNVFFDEITGEEKTETISAQPTFDKEWLYLSVPIIYSPSTNEVTLYGFPAFVASPKHENLNRFDAPFQGADWQRSDRDLGNSRVLAAQMEAFMVAWSKQNPNISPTGELAALLSTDATNRAKEGLNGSVVANPENGNIVRKIDVEALTEAQLQNATGNEIRKALIDVEWVTTQDLQQQTVTPYKQQYIVFFRGNDTASYKIVDIRTRYAQ